MCRVSFCHLTLEGQAVKHKLTPVFDPVSWLPVPDWITFDEKICFRQGVA